VSAPTVGVVGAGAVGQTVCASLVATGLPHRLLIVSRRREQTRGLAADLQDLAQSSRSRVEVEAGDAADLHGCEAVVVALRSRFTNTARCDVRRAGAAANTPAVAALARELRGFPGIVLVITNPVDLMARLFAEVSGCARVYGIGSNLDSARYRLILAGYAQVPPQAVHGQVIGEHGDRAVVCASSTTVDGRPVRVPIPAVLADLRHRAALIPDAIGRTRSGPAGALLSTLRKALGLIDGIEQLSTPYRDSGVWLGQPVHFTGGAVAVRLPDLDTDEQRRLDAAATSLRDAYTLLPAHTEKDTT
jgi:L-lactate dehydrogenase